jgi:hypothetical protein
MNLKKLAVRAGLVSGCLTLLVACAASPETPMPAPLVALDNAPMLERFARFEIIANARELRIPGRLRFHPEGAFLEARADGASSAGRLDVQPEQCRDEANPYCARRFTLSGRIPTELGLLNCYMQVRNDLSVGYMAQGLSGVCQDKNGRAYSISIFSE